MAREAYPRDCTRSGLRAARNGDGFGHSARRGLRAGQNNAGFSDWV